MQQQHHQPPVRERTPYLRYLKDCLHQIDEIEFFAPDLITARNKCLDSNLPELSLCLLARLLMREGEWHRSDKLVSCMPRDLHHQGGAQQEQKHQQGSFPVSAAAEAGLQEAMAGLIEAGMLQVLSEEENSFDEVWAALAECLLVEELRQVYCGITKVKAKGNKDDLINSIYKAAKTSVDLFKRPVSLFRQVKIILRTVRLVRVSPSLLTSLRRLQRVFQLSSDIMTSGGRGGLSTSRPLHFNAPMLVMMGKIRYPRYQIVATTPVFPSHTSFCLWEAANELRVCYDDVASLIIKKTEFSSYLLRPACSREGPRYTKQKSKDNELSLVLEGTGLGLEVSGLTPLQKTWVYAMRNRILSAVAVFDSGSISCSGGSNSSTESMTEVTESMTEVKAVGANFAKSTTDNTASNEKINIFLKPSVIVDQLLSINTVDVGTVVSDEVAIPRVANISLSLLSFITIGAAACLSAYVEKLLSAEAENLTQTLPFLNQLDAGNLLSAICYDGIEMLEKEVRDNKSVGHEGEGESVSSETNECDHHHKARGDQEESRQKSHVKPRKENNKSNRKSEIEPIEFRNISSYPRSPNQSLVFLHSSYALPVQLLRLLIYGEYRSDSVSSYSDVSHSDVKHAGRCQQVIRQYASHRVGKCLERLCIDLEHEGRMEWSLIEAEKALVDPDVQASYRIGFHKRIARLKLSVERLKNRHTDFHFPSFENTLLSICFGDTYQNTTPAGMTVSSSTCKKNESAVKKRQRSSLNAPPAALSGGGGSGVATGQTSDDSAWSCSGCTLLNSSKYWKCTLCQTDRVKMVMPPYSATSNSSLILPKCNSAAQHDVTVISDDDDDDIFEAPVINNLFTTSSCKKKIAKKSKDSVERSESTARSTRDKELSDLGNLTLPNLSSCGVALSSVQLTKSSAISTDAKQSGYFNSPNVNLLISTTNNTPTNMTSLMSAGAAGSSTSNLSPPLLPYYCRSPLSEDAMRTLIFNNKLKNHDYTLQCFDSMVRTLVIAGRRLGSLRQGKNKLIGVSGDAVSVEALVMQTMEMEYEEGVVSCGDINYKDYDDDEFGCNFQKGFEAHGIDTNVNLKGGNEASDTILQEFCGGWVGWHCEGSLLRTIFGLMMWTELFICDNSNILSSMSENENQFCSTDASDSVFDKVELIDETRESNNRPVIDTTPPVLSSTAPRSIHPIPDVFRSPYQDAPLDLFTPGGLFYLNRKGAIEDKLNWIQSASLHDIITFIGETYRSNYKSRCVGVSWFHPLKTLQMVAVCLHAKGGLYTICKIMSIDYRQFISGAPDLLMIRGFHVRDDSHFASSASKEMWPGVTRQCFSRGDWDHCLGKGWEQLGNNKNNNFFDSGNDFEKGESLYSDGPTKIVATKNEEENGTQTGHLPSASKPNNKFIYVAGKRKYVGNRKEICKQPNIISSSDKSNKNLNHFSIFQKKKPRLEVSLDDVIVINSDVESDNECETKAEPNCDAHSVAAEMNDEIVNANLYTSLEQTPKLPWQFQCCQTDLVLPLSTPNDILAGENFHDKEKKKQLLSERLYDFEFALVEVKGPTDRLSDRQRIWCQALAAHGLNVKVCRVHEDKGGNHLTAISP